MVMPIYSISDSRIIYGFSVHGFNHLEGLISEQTGSEWIRTDIKYNGSHYLGTEQGDCLGYRVYGQKLLGILDYWTMNLSDTFTLADWNIRVNDTVRHYNDTIYAYEIWNEPNVYGFQYGYMDSTQHYYDMLKEAYQIIKDINSTFIVIAGSLSDIYEQPTGDNWEDWFTDLLTLGANNYCDVWSIHLYAGQKRAYAMEIMNVTDKPTWVTETGYNITLNGENYQAEWLDHSLEALTTCANQPQLIFVYNLYGDFGVVNANYTHRANYNVYTSYSLAPEKIEPIIWYQNPVIFGIMIMGIALGVIILWKS